MARAINRGGGRHLVRADIGRFYGTIYTHSIPWALHSKSVAKRDRTFALLGNRLDAWLRKGQSSQTVGIPIGPDTSLLIAEVILSAVDLRIRDSRPGIRALRYMDDFEFVVSSQSEATDVQVILQAALGEYELALNADKTRVESLPQSLQNAYAEGFDRSVRQDPIGHSGGFDQESERSDE